MGLIISEDEANARLNNPDNLANRSGNSSNKTSSLQDSYNKSRDSGPNNDSDQLVSIRPVDNGGRRPGDTNVPEVIRAATALLAQAGEPTKDIASAFGISKTSVDQYKEGNTSFGRPSQKLREVIKQNMDQIQEKAIKKMLKGIDFMDFDDDEKMKKVSYRDMSHILLNLSKLNSNEIEDNSDRQSTKLIVYAPIIRTEHHFQTVEVKES